MTTTLNTSCSENTMVLSARRGVSAWMYFLVYNYRLRYELRIYNSVQCSEWQLWTSNTVVCCFYVYLGLY